jgi:hypothetical protein
MKKLLFLFAALAICLVSCDPPETELSDYTNKENSFVAMLNYLPYKANQSYTFVHDDDNTQWTFKPYSGGIYGNEFPVGISDMDGSIWYNSVAAEFVANDDTRHRTKLMMELNPEGDSFYFYASADLVVETGSCYTGFITLNLDSAQLNTLLCDTIFIPLKKKSYYTGQAGETLPENSVAYLVKNKGLAEFSIDGGRTYWRLAE